MKKKAKSKPKRPERKGAIVDSQPEPCPSYSVATVEWIRGKRLLSTFIRNAGLGITGVGIKERMDFRYKPGEIVTEERVMKAVQSMIDQSNAEKTAFEISCPRVIRIFEVNGKPSLEGE